MNTKKQHTFYKRLNIYRKAVQVFSLAFLVAVPLLVINEVYLIIGNLYAITIAGIEIVDPAIAFQTMLLSRELIESLLVGLIIPILLAFVLGKVFCSWMCPFNTLSEYWFMITTKIFRNRYKKISFGLREQNPNSIIFWSILIFFFILTFILDFPVITFLSAPGIISSEISHLVMGMGLGFEIVIILLIIFIEGLLLKSYWCKYVCPVGGVLAIFRIKNTLRIVYNADACKCPVNFEPCNLSCPLDLSPKRKNLYPCCFNCGECIKVCEKSNSAALRFSFGSNNSNNKLGIKNSPKEEIELTIKE